MTKDNDHPTLKITEIFYSLQGESSTVGYPTVFVRLTGCPLRCQYCDTAYAFSGGQRMSLETIVDRVSQHQAHYVTVTGGEPLAQPNCLPLLTRLCDQGYRVSLETSGAMDVSVVDPRVVIILDIKTPGSKEQSRNHWQNLACLRPTDEVKFVICDRQDYDWSLQIIAEYNLQQRSQILFSPSHQQLAASQLADWILADKAPVRLQVQLHKILWNDEPGR